MSKVTAQQKMFLIQGYSAGLLHLFMVKTPICLTRTLVNWSFLASLSEHTLSADVLERCNHVTVEKRGVNACTAEYKLGNSVDQKLYNH